MASTIAIATSFNIKPETLESWLQNRPTDGEDAAIASEIFSKFDYVDGDWQPKSQVASKKTKTKTKKTAKSQKKTKTAASTQSNTAEDRTSINTATSITSFIPSENQVESDSTETIAAVVPPAVAEESSIAKTKTKKTADRDETHPTRGSAPGSIADPEVASAAEAIKNTGSVSATTTEVSKDKDSDLPGFEEATESVGPKVLFSAVGIIRGEVTIDEKENQHTVKFGGKTYPLFYARKNYTAFTGLKKEIAATGSSTGSVAKTAFLDH